MKRSLEKCLLALANKPCSPLSLSQAMNRFEATLISNGPFTSLKKQAKTLFWLICYERKTLFQLKRQAETILKQFPVSHYKRCNFPIIHRKSSTSLSTIAWIFSTPIHNCCQLSWQLQLTEVRKYPFCPLTGGLHAPVFFFILSLS